LTLLGIKLRRKHLFYWCW